MLTKMDPALLAAAFPPALHPAALPVCNAVGRGLFDRQWTDRFAADVAGETVLIPERLHFASHNFGLPSASEAQLIAAALLSRSNDGFQRQPAARYLVADLRPWAAPFVVRLIGEYVLEIIEDIDRAVGVDEELLLAAFVKENSQFWEITKQRVISYWNVYYRHRRRGAATRSYARGEYIGFSLIERIDRAAARVTH